MIFPTIKQTQCPDCGCCYREPTPACPRCQPEQVREAHRAWTESANDAHAVAYDVYSDGWTGANFYRVRDVGMLMRCGRNASRDELAADSMKLRLVVAWVRELERWPKGVLVVGEHGRRWVRFEDVLDAGWLCT